MSNVKHRSVWLWLFILLLLAGCSTSKEPFNGSYVSIKINPEIDFLLNEEGNVTDVFYANTEAKIIYSDVDFIDKTISECMDIIIREAVNTGYIDLITSYNAILLYGYQEDDASQEFLDELIQMMERKLSEEAIGGLVLKQSEYDDELRSLMQDHDLSVQEASLVLAYVKATQEEASEVIGWSMDKLMGRLKNAFDASMSENLSNQTSYISEKRDLESIQINDVREYRKGVLQGTIDDPDLTDVMDEFVHNPNQVLERIQTRNQSIRPFVQARKSGDLENYVVGQYVFESVRNALTYRVVNHVLIVNSDGSFQETYHWSSEMHDVTASNTMTWNITDKKLDVTYDSGLHMFYQISSGRLIETMLNGNVKTYVKVSSMTH